MQVTVAGNQQPCGPLGQLLHKKVAELVSTYLPRQLSPRAACEGSCGWHAAKHEATHHGDEGWHAAKHQAAHRISEKATFGLAERLLEQVVSEPAAGFLAQSAWSQKSAFAAVGDSFFAANGTMHAMVAYAAADEERRHAAGILQSSLSALRVLLPLVGAVIIFQTTREDWHRAHQEWRSKGGSKGRALIMALFLLAALCGTLDALVHLAIVMDLTIYQLDHHFLHSLETWSRIGAGIAIMSVVLGEGCVVRSGIGNEKVKTD
jgi:hypothetical protein